MVVAGCGASSGATTELGQVVPRVVAGGVIFTQGEIGASIWRSGDARFAALAPDEGSGWTLLFSNDAPAVFGPDLRWIALDSTTSGALDGERQLVAPETRIQLSHMPVSIITAILLPGRSGLLFTRSTIDAGGPQPDGTVLVPLDDSPLP